MLRVEPTSDFDYATAVVRRPEVYARIRDDSTPPIGDISLAGVNGIVLRAYDGDEPCGFFLLIERHPRVFEVHTTLTVRGSRAVKFGRLGARWVFAHTHCVKLISTCRANNRSAHVYASLLGFQDDFELWPAIIDGQPVPQVEVSLHRAEWAAKHYTS